MNECGAKTRSGTPCKKAGMANGRCRLHGGLTPIKHGRYSKANLKTLSELVWQSRLQDILRTVKRLEPYLDDATKEGLERALEAYLEDGKIKV
jgi:hypothetical protein